MELLPELPRQYNAVELQKILNDFMQRAVGDNIVNFVDRGDISSVDFTLASFTTDETWRDLDLSAIIPVGTKSILFRVELMDDVIGNAILFRKKGNSNSTNSSAIITQVVSKYIISDLICPVSSDRKIQYWGTNTIFGDITFVIKGWFI